MGKNIFEKNKRNWRLFFVHLIVFLAIGLLTKKINLVTADLGRHIKNGEVFFQTGKIVETNYYSYTYPDFEVNNHHWLSGIIFYLIWKISGFYGLSFFYLAVSVLIVCLTLLTARAKSNNWISSFFMVLALPILGTRAEIRPEIFSYLFTVLLFYCLTKYENRKFPFIFFILFFICQFAWINLHILWIFGPFLVGASCFYYLFIKKNKKIFWNRFKLLILVIIALFLNPFGYRAVFEPFFIFREYGYSLAENQTLFFMQKRSWEFRYFYIELMALSWIVLAFLKIGKKDFNYLNFILSIFFICFGFWMIRNFVFFGMFFAILGSWKLHNLIKKSKKYDLINQSLNYLTIILAIIFLFNKNLFIGAFKRNFGLGLMPDVMRSAHFVKAKNIKGPIFNNYDNGGYLIYELWPERKVFVDNRPEAYPVDFFENKYKKMTDENVWRQIDEKYKFNLIYFYRHDMTPWGQEFLVQRVNDRANWSPIFVDSYVIMFVRRNEENKELIENYELPEEMFGVS